MPKFLFVSSLVALTACAALLPVGCASAPAAESEPTLGTSRAGLTKGGLVISQVFTGDQGTVLNQDFVELFNPSSADVDLAGSSLQIAAGSGNFDAAGTIPLTGTVKSNSYFLVALKQTTSGAPSITKTAQITETSIDLVAQAGKVVIALQTAPLGCGAGGDCDPADYIDLFGWGGANQYEAQAFTGMDAGNGAIRKKDGCTDTNNNVNDFEKQRPAPRAASDAPLGTCTPRDAGVDSGKPIPVTDPDPGEDPGDVDAGGRDAGRAPVVAATGDDGCSVSAVGLADTSLLGLVFAAGAVVLGRRRRRA